MPTRKCVEQNLQGFFPRSRISPPRDDPWLFQVTMTGELSPAAKQTPNPPCLTRPFTIRQTRQGGQFEQLKDSSPLLGPGPDLAPNDVS
ncbi:hypothetical protein RRG08_034396 [Elysia crispata]|uniref:Uncharacterized protein n=1 Tax=Elysia crispata TaxID=231223 RepID=A0AAE0YD71_9GAST|nr:hypothetical protein RRG08_034396 [Elysia crispata]